MHIGTPAAELMLFRLSIAVLAWLVPVFPGRVDAASPGVPDLSIRFNEQTIELSGRVDSEETAQKLALAAHGARPDLKVVNEGLVVDEDAALPPYSDLRSLIAELGLSTHQGRFEIWPDRILIGGLTDSIVTLTALRIRLEPILGKRRFINHICIVGTEYLPKIEVSLTSNVNGGETPVLDLTPSREMAFEPPGLLVEKLFPTLVMLSDFDRLEGKTSTPAVVIRATPLAMTSNEPSSGPGEIPASDAAAVPATMLSATPVQQYETLPTVRFSRNSFLLQSNQEPVFEELTRYLLAPDRKGRAVTIEAVKPSGGSADFNDYLSERRTAELVRFLTERGIDAATLNSGIVNSASPIDEGEVRVKVAIPILPPEPPPVTGTTE
jgi:outer membrane protein OmpA-like peptidoglycan-associated protein